MSTSCSGCQRSHRLLNINLDLDPLQWSVCWHDYPVEKKKNVIKSQSLLGKKAPITIKCSFSIAILVYPRVHSYNQVWYTQTSPQYPRRFRSLGNSSTSAGSSCPRISPLHPSYNMPFNPYQSIFVLFESKIVQSPIFTSFLLVQLFHILPIYVFFPHRRLPKVILLLGEARKEVEATKDVADIAGRPKGRRWRRYRAHRNPPLTQRL